MNFFKMANIDIDSLDKNSKFNLSLNYYIWWAV